MSSPVTVTLRPSIDPAVQNLAAENRDTVDWSALANVPSIVPGAGIEGGGSLETDVSIGIADGGIITAKLADDAVTAAKLADNAVDTNAIVNLAVTTGKIADSAVTSAKIANGAIVNDDVNASANIATTKVLHTSGRTGSSAMTQDAYNKLFVTAKEFGATPDWNGSAGTDNGPLIEAALDYLYSRGGGKLLITEPGSYKVSTKIAPTVAADVEIEWAPGAVFLCPASYEDPVLEINDVAAGYDHSLILRNPQIDVSRGTSRNATDSATCIATYRLKNVILENVDLYGGLDPLANDSGSNVTLVGGDSGFADAGSLNVEVRGGRIQGFHDAGIYPGGDTVNGGGNDGISFKVSNVLFRYCNNAMTPKREQASIEFHNNHVIYCNAGVIPGEANGTGVPKRLIATGNHFRLCTSNLLRARGAMDAAFIGNTFEDWGYSWDGAAESSTGSIVYAITVYGTNGVTIKDNTFWCTFDRSALTNQRSVYFENTTINSVLNTHGYHHILGNTHRGVKYAYNWNDAGNPSIIHDEFYDVVTGIETGSANASNLYTYSLQGKAGLYLKGWLSIGAPVTKSADFTLADSENSILNTKAGSNCVVTLPAASSCVGRVVEFTTQVAFSVVSASSNVIPQAGGAAGTTITGATAGNWARLVSNGTNWQIIGS